MLEQRRYTLEEIDRIIAFAHQVDNMQAVCEALDHMEFFGHEVRVVKGRKVPIGTVGQVFWLARVHYSRSSFVGFQTRLGIRTESGVVYFTTKENVELTQAPVPVA